ncbi:MAG: methylglyoxal synthase [Stappia sp.]|uniref:methylglyoxal synthase n=1 Tax=Stappia sp. TaxID=1870903 RepID=UPI000C5EADC3|nr:methylglyoxal synthase [Stappia sp.]MBM20584.1 methylglyoxal synthase [Stappia sp.]
MAFDFIFMLTEDDRTIADARARLDDVLAGGARHIGFKDVGLPFEELKGLARDIRTAGGRAYLEVVSLDAESELRSARAAIGLEVDCLLGGTRPGEVAPLLKAHPIRYYPFPGEIVGHPSVLAGTVPSITESAKRLSDLESVHGLDLLAYRHEGDVPGLMQSVCAATDKPVIVAGSIDRAERIEAVAAAGAAGFTVGTAAFKGQFAGGGRGLSDEVRAILSLTMAARARSTAPRRIALVAHNARKSHLKAWASRHARVLARQRLVATGGTGAMLMESVPELSIRRLQRGSHGGDQQLGALIATGELDAVIFFADPHGHHASDVDLMALTRLAILHDTPIACSPAAADLVVAASLGG